MIRRTILYLLLVFCSIAATAQTEPPATPAGEFYSATLIEGQQPIPFLPLRESDIVWKTTLWKKIDLAELFNQYIFFPIDNPDPSGKKSLAYILWDAVVENEIPIYEDDDLLVPLDNEVFVRKYTKADTIVLELGYDDDDNEMYLTTIQPHEFDGYDVRQYALREVWFIGRQDTRQDSRRMALAPTKKFYRKHGNMTEEEYVGIFPIFWVPMQHPAVRRLLARYTAYIDDNNLALQPSWDNIFLSQRYEAYITRESNKYNRSISQYLTGEDALLRAQTIEDKVFNIEADMWEY